MLRLVSDGRNQPFFLAILNSDHLVNRRLISHNGSGMRCLRRESLMQSPTICRLTIVLRFPTPDPHF
jgi:hypothetical protein